MPFLHCPNTNNEKTKDQQATVPWGLPGTVKRPDLIFAEDKSSPPLLLGRLHE